MQFSYANFDSSGIHYGQARDCDFSHGALSQCRLKAFSVNTCRFIGTGFFKTKLKGLDFSDSELASVQLSDTLEELAGAAVIRGRPWSYPGCLELSLKIHKK